MPVAASGLYVRVAGAAVQASSPPTQRAIPPAPLAEWDFSQASAPFLSTAADLPLTQGHGSVFVTRTTSPWGYAASLPSGGAYLKLDAASIERLNIGAAGGSAVTVAAWVWQTDTNIGFAAGCWQEDDGDPRRQYGLFGDLDFYGGNDRVCMHVSKTGGPTPGYPYSRDYAASNETYTRSAWHFWAGTYDGLQAIAYLDGVASSYRDFTDNKGQTYDKNPYLFSLGLNDTPCDFTVGAVQLSSGMGNHLQGQIAKLRVWDEALTPQDIRALYSAEASLIP